MFRAKPKEIKDMSNKLNVQSIFDSIDGEANGFDGAGQLTTFIRLKGCQLRCSYCDTKYAQNAEPVNWMTIDEIIQEVHFPKVTITGGEPLLQRTRLWPLIDELLTNAYKITMETNGTEPPLAEIDTSFRELRYIVDFKLPSSGVMEHMNSMVFSSLSHNDVIKFVISDVEDYKYAKMLIQEQPSWKAKKVMSPALSVLQYESICRECNGHEVHDGKCYNCGTKAGTRFDMTWPRLLVEMMIKDRVDAQFSLQLHKILWPGAKEER